MRPILTSLNGDNSWLISFPRPGDDRRRSGKAYYHAVHDPWLNGPSIEGLSWLAKISLSNPPAATSGAEVEKLVLEIENDAAKAGLVQPLPVRDIASSSASPIDAIFQNFHYGDHLHKPTLATFNSSIPVFAASEGAVILRKWGHFDQVIQYKDLNPDSFDGDWTTLHPGSPLPPFLSIFRMRGHHELNFLSAVMWTNSSGKHEAILYTPHGLKGSEPSVQALSHGSKPDFTVLAMLHGLKENWVMMGSWQTTFGVKSGLQLYRQTGSKYWINSHNDALSYRGLLRWITYDIFRTIAWGLGEEKKSAKEGMEASKAVEVIDVVNGRSLVLQ